MDDAKQKKKTLIIIAALVAVLVGFAILISIFAPRSNNSFGPEVKIDGYSERISNLSEEMRETIFATLFNTVKLNVSDDTDIESINDAFIRAQSERQTRSDTSGMYEGTFIVDIPSIKQSYLVEYNYDPNNPESNPNPVIIRCLPMEQTIYDDFECVDINTSESAGVDPILAVVPYSTLSYDIKATIGEDDKLTVTIRAILSEADRRIDEQGAIDTAYAEARTWMSNNNLNPENYTIVYTTN